MFPIAIVFFIILFPVLIPAAVTAIHAIAEAGQRRRERIANSLGDILSCALGFGLASRLGFRGSVVCFLVTELVLLLWIRDGLLLTIVMLVCPFEGIKAWQTGG